jgi:predicted transcriptional regulator
MTERSAMKTTTLRLEDPAMELLEGLARLTDRSPADIIRKGVLEYLTRLVNEDSDYREEARKLDREITERAKEDAIATVLRGMGREPMSETSTGADPDKARTRA